MIPEEGEPFQSPFPTSVGELVVGVPEEEGGVNGQLDLPVGGQWFSWSADSRIPGGRTADLQIGVGEGVGTGAARRS